MRLRGLLWLIAFVTLVWPPSFGGPHKAMAHDGAPTATTAMPDCPDHAPPPCPMNDTAKHAAGTCCPAMTGAVALLTDEAPAAPPRAVYCSFIVSAVASLSGLTFTQDPPPPRA